MIRTSFLKGALLAGAFAAVSGCGGGSNGPGPETRGSPAYQDFMRKHGGKTQSLGSAQRQTISRDGALEYAHFVGACAVVAEGQIVGVVEDDGTYVVSYRYERVRDTRDASACEPGRGGDACRADQQACGRIRSDLERRLGGTRSATMRTYVLNPALMP